MSSQLPNLPQARIGFRDGEFQGPQDVAGADQDLAVRNITAAVAYGIQAGQWAICDVLAGTSRVLGPRTEGQ